MALRDYVFPGKAFDEWEVGEEHITGARTITEADIVNFAGLSGDWSATHTNDVYGKSTIYGSRIAYGNVTFLVSLGLISQTRLFEGTTQALLSFRISYQEAVRFQDTIYCKFTVEEKRPCEHSDRGVLTIHSLVFNQNDEQVAEEQLVFLVSKEKAHL
ncbi:MAG: dehydratase [Oscillospiraceae bacterium]|nr:dehydratase [Oscillospiraceae bacterium]